MRKITSSLSPNTKVTGLNNNKQNNISLFNGLVTSNNKENNPFTIKSSSIVARNLPPAIKQWVNSIYSFNKNYTKTLPVVDVIVNKIIRSFFSINPLANNPGGKKSRLVQRRFKRLSLNRIFVSKPEIKHNNDKVFITVYLFNKKKKSLLYKLKHLYENITHKRGLVSSSNKSFLSTKKKLGAKPSRSNRKTKRTFYVRNKKNYVMTAKIAARLYRKHKTMIGKSNSLYRLVRKSKKLTLYNHYKKSNRNRKRNRNYFNKNVARKLYNNFYAKFRSRSNSKKNRSIFSVVTRKNVFNYKKTSLLTKIKIMKFIELLNKKTKDSILYSKVLKKTYNNKPRNLDSGLLLKNNNLTFGARAIPSFTRSSAILKTYYNALNKYKLYNDNNYIINFGPALPLKVQDNNNNINYNILSMESAINKPMLHINNIYKYLKLRQRFMLGLHKSNVLTNIDKINSGFYALKKGNLNTSGGQSPLQKVNVLYKLFTLYSDVKFYQDSALLTNTSSLNSNVINSKGFALENKKLNSLSIYSSKITLNTYKLLKKSFAYFTAKIGNKHTKSSFKPSNKVNNKKLSINKYTNNKIKAQKLIHRPISKFISLYRHSAIGSSNRLSNYKARLLWLRKVKGKRLSRIYIKRAIKKLILLEKLNKINRFFQKYSKTLNKTNNLSYNDNSTLSISQKNVAAMYKLNYIKAILDKDLLYVYYLKMLSFNTNLFKNWFLNSLKNILSKIYNKKVILNLVSLKYIHLNSDIFTQAITVRLRNFKKNRLNKVLRKALKLIVLSKINNYSYDIHSPVNKFIESYYSKFKGLNMDIFNDVNNTATSSKELSVNTPLSINTMYSPKAIKGLSSVQSSTINFIRHKSVFGVRLEAAGRLTKRSTASRAIFKIRYKGSLRNNTTINRKDTSTMIKNQRISNLQFTKISSKTRNGSFGLKGWLNNN